VTHYAIRGGFSRMGVPAQELRYKVKIESDLTN